MNSLNNILLQWTNKKELQSKTKEEIKLQINKTCNEITTLNKTEVTPQIQEILVICLEIIEQYSNNEVCIKPFNELKQGVIDLTIPGQYLYLRPMSNANQTNSELTEKVQEALNQHKNKKIRPFVVRSYAPKFYEEKNERYFIG
jgi:hypothetical protein